VEIGHIAMMGKVPAINPPNFVQISQSSAEILPLVGNSKMAAVRHIGFQNGGFWGLTHRKTVLR
jgi:hypothetical protein